MKARQTINQKCLLVATVLLLVSVAPVFGQSYSSDVGHVEFLSSVPLHSFVGSSDVLTGVINLTDASVDFYVDLESIRTGNRKRDKDMRKTLETDEYPFAEFYGSLDSTVDSLLSEPQPVKVSGDFTIHGVSRKIDVSGTLQFVDGGVLVRAEFIILLDDFEITPPRLLVFKVDQEQRISLSSTLERQ